MHSFERISFFFHVFFLALEVIGKRDEKAPAVACVSLLQNISKMFYSQAHLRGSYKKAHSVLISLSYFCCKRVLFLSRGGGRGKK